MPSWFSRVFGGKDAAPETEETSAAGDAAKEQSQQKDDDQLFGGEYITQLNPILDDEDETEPWDDMPKPRPPRNIIEPVLLTDDAEEASPHAGGIRIKAEVSEDFNSCRFMVDRAVLEGLSVWIPFPHIADISPLAQKLFALDGVECVTIHGANVTVSRDPMARGGWDDLAKQIGQTIREHLDAGEDVVTPEFRENVPPENEIAETLQRVIETEINPGIAAHSGAIALEGVKGNTVYIRMMGGCQGCAASTITLKQGIHQAFREAVPQIGAILDETDHAAGTNPYYSELPPGMSAYA